MHHVHYINGIAVLPIENTAGGFHNLTVTEAAQLCRLRATLWIIGKLFDVGKYARSEIAGRRRIMECYVVSNAVEIGEGGFGLNYFSHRAMRFLASAWETTRPSSMARSPRAIPSSSAMRRSSAS